VVSAAWAAVSLSSQPVIATVACVERRKQRQHAVDHRLALRRALAPGARRAIVFHWLEG
jgi:hypothetical protein